MDQIYWIEPDGTQHYLMDIPNIAVLADGIAGWGMPPVEHVEDRIPLRAGSRFRSVITQPRDLDLPLHFRADTPDLLHAKIRDVLRWFYPKRTDGPGKIKVETGLGDTRELWCRYSSGLQGDERQSSGQTSPTHKNHVITLRAVDPFWYGPLSSIQEYVQGTTATFFGNPWFPLKLTRTDIFSAPIATNPGDVEAWPVWTITGPMTRIVLSNNSGDAALIDMTYTLLSGQTITIDTREDQRTVKKNDGTNLYYAMTPESYLWPILRGDNSLHIDMTGADATSRVKLEFMPRYLGF